MKQLIASAIFISLLMPSCRFLAGQRISGDGHVIDHEASVGSFNSVDVGGSIDVHLTHGASSNVKIHADQNLIPYIDVYTNGNTLVVHEKSGFNLDPSGKVIVYVSAPEFNDIDVSGAGDVVGDSPINGQDHLKIHVSGSGDVNMNVDVPSISTETSGAGKVILKGQAKDFNAEINGSGDVDCFDLVTENTTLEISGAGSAKVNAGKKLDVHVSGSGDVQYKGNPSVSQDISGAGSIKKVD